MWFYNGVMHPKDNDGKANSVDPDQTVPPGDCSSRSSLMGLHCLPRCMSEHSGPLHGHRHEKT